MTDPAPFHDHADPRRFRLQAHADLGVEVLHASLTDHEFDPHFHDSYLVGFTCAGVERFEQAGRPYVSLPGQVRIIDPGVVHTGAPGDDRTWRYMALYVAPTAFTDLHPEADAGPVFDRAVIEDAELFRTGLGLIASLAEVVDPVEREERLAVLLMRLMRHQHGADHSALRAEPEKVRLARQYIRARIATVVRLDELAAAVGFSKFHLLRTFKAATGLTPWRYQVQLRLASARDLLRDGVPASQVAVICGFFDQSHFTRLYRASFGITPAAFQAAYRS
ncbi:MAG TPA: AraC family transcriptional regulator, partial [Sphingomonas sp.]